MRDDKAYFARLATFCYDRAMRATCPKWRTRWFDAFEVATA